MVGEQNEQIGVDTRLPPPQGAKTIIADGGEETPRGIITAAGMMINDVGKIMNETMVEIATGTADGDIVQQIALDKSDPHLNRKYRKKSRSQLSDSRRRDKQSILVEFTCLLSK